LNDRFDTVGELTPNKDEIHLDPSNKHDTAKFNFEKKMTHVIF